MSRFLKSLIFSAFLVLVVADDETEESTTPRDLWIDVMVALLGGGVTVFSLYTAWVVFRKRQYTYIKAKQPEIIIAQQLAAAVWIVATIVSNGHFSRDSDNVSGACYLWDVWLKVGVGSGIWTNCLVIRLWRLYKQFCRLDVGRFNKNRGTKSKAKKGKVSMSPFSIFGWKEFYGPLCGLMGPLILCCFMVTLAGGQEFAEEKGQCKFSSKIWTFLIIIVSMIPFGLFWWFLHKLKDIRDEFNEFRETKQAFYGAGALFVIGFVMQSLKWMGLDFDEFRVATRVILTISVVACVFLVFIKTAWQRMWSAMVRHEEFLKEYTEGLKRGTFINGQQSQGRGGASQRPSSQAPNSALSPSNTSRPMPSRSTQDRRHQTIVENPMLAARNGVPNPSVSMAISEAELPCPSPAVRASDAGWRLGIGLGVFTFVVYCAGLFQFLKKDVVADWWFRLSDLMDLSAPWLIIAAVHWIFTQYAQVRHRYVYWLWFMLGAGMLGDGHGIHLAANLVKRPIKYWRDDHADTYNSDPIFKEQFDTIEVWDNAIGHYIYGAGVMTLVFLLLWVHRNVMLSIPVRVSTSIKLGVAGFFFGVMFFLAAITFTYAVVPALLYCTIYLFGSIYWIHKQEQPLNILFRRMLVPMYFFVSNITALVCLILWVGGKGFGGRKDTDDWEYPDDS